MMPEQYTRVFLMQVKDSQPGKTRKLNISYPIDLFSFQAKFSAISRWTV